MDDDIITILGRERMSHGHNLSVAVITTTISYLAISHFPASHFQFISLTQKFDEYFIGDTEFDIYLR